MEIIAAVAREPKKYFSIETAEIEAPRAGEVLVRIVGVGLCHTDLVARDQIIPVPLPAVLGHEGSGIVEAVGSGVTKVKAGDRVVLSFLSCGGCPRCEDDLPAYCRDFPMLNFAGVRTDGSSGVKINGAPVSANFFGQSSFASYALAHERNVVKVDADDAALKILGPLGCGLQTGAGAVMRSLECPAGSTIVIFGGGPVGLAGVMGAVIQGCSTIILVEPIAARRDMALSLGATHVIDPIGKDVGAAVREILPGGVDFALDTSGLESVIMTGLGVLASYGMLGLVGVPPSMESTLSVNIGSLITFGHRIKGIIEGDSDLDGFIPELIAHHRDGRFPFEKLIKTYPLKDINEAVAAQHRGDCIKAVLLP